MLRCAVLNVSVGTACHIFRDPSLRFPLGSGAGKWSASFSKNACRFGYAI